MWLDVILSELHFSINVIAALVFFSVSWLYFDAWTVRRKQRELICFLGFVFVSLSFLVHAATIESTIATTALLESSTLPILSGALEILGEILIIASLLVDPIADRPVNAPLQAKSPALFAFPLAFGFGWGIIGVRALLAATVGVMYLRRAIAGLERHLVPIAISFLFLSAVHLVEFAVPLRETSVVWIYNLVAPFGIAWTFEHVLLIIVLGILIRWVFAYLLKRFETQLFIIFTTSIVGIFLLTTGTFTTLLLGNIADQTLSQLSTDVRVLSYALESKKGETLSDAQVLSQNPALPALMRDSSKIDLKDLVEGYFVSKRTSSLAVVGVGGQVLARGEDRDRFGDSLSGDELAARALKGESVSGLVQSEGVIAPNLSVRAAAPVKENGAIIGAVLADSIIDTAFVDGVKASTGLDSTLYGGNQISATTLTTHGLVRPLGMTEPSRDITTAVLDRAESFRGEVAFVGQPYLAAYEPIVDLNSIPIGMMAVGIPQKSVLATAGKSIEMTFLVVIVLLVVSIIPAYLIAKSIVSQIR